MRLDLGSGQVGPKEGYEGVDLFPYPGTSWVCDLEEFPWVFRAANMEIPGHPEKVHATEPMDFDGTFYGKPHPIGEEPCLPSNSVEAVVCSHLVEHVRDLTGFMAELWRVCKPGAEVVISHPYQFNTRAWQDPTHVRCLNEVSWFYFDRKWRQERDEFGTATDFELIDLDAIPEPNWQKVADENPEEFERAARNQINVISDLRVTLRCRK